MSLRHSWMMSAHDIPGASFSHFSIGSNLGPLLTQPGSSTIVGYGPGQHIFVLAAQLEEFRTTEHLCDIRLKMADGVEFPAHRVILAAASPYFNALFNSSFLDALSAVHELSWMSSDTGRNVLTFIYSGKISLDYARVSQMLAAAEYLMLPQLKKHCLAFMKNILNTKHVCRIKYLAELYQLEELQDQINEILNNSACAESFSDEHLVEVPFTFLHGLLMDTRFKHLREVDLVEFILRWVRHDETNRQEYLAKLMNCVLFQCLPAWYIAKLSDDSLTKNLVEPYIVSKPDKAEGTSDSAEDVVLVVCSGTSSPCLGYIPKQDQWVGFSALPKNMDTRRKGLKPVCIKGKLYLLVTMEESMAWLPSSVNTGFSAVQFWCLDVERDRWCELRTPNSTSKCFHLVACGDMIFALGISGTLERYDADKDLWRPCCPPTRTVAFFDTIHFSDGKLLYVLNIYSTSYPSGGGNCLQVYDAVTDSWTMSGLNNKENDLVVLSYRLPSRRATAVRDGQVISLYNTLGQHWATIDIEKVQIECWKWKTILPAKIYSGHGWTINIPHLNSLFILNSSNNQCAMFDHDTGYYKLTAKCPIQIYHGQKSGCRSQISSVARDRLIQYR